MNLIKPQNLKKGDTIAIISPCGNIEKEKVVNSIKYFEEKGYKVKLGQNVFAKDRYMAGSDKKRIEDLEWAFSDKSINAIICSRGGYGALRIINKIDYEIIKNNPKIFCGYSDVTALSLMILKKTGLITYSSPMIKGDFQPEDLDLYTQEQFFKTLSGEIRQIKPTNLKVYKNGKTQGILWGGNLATVASLCGLDFIPDEKFIFFAEDLNEPVYKIDRYFRQLLNIQGFRNKITGIVLGDFLDVEYPQQLDILVNEIAEELNIPIYGGYKITHAKSKLTIPIGLTAKLDENGLIMI